jgi:hypothetical protein
MSARGKTMFCAKGNADTSKTGAVRIRSVGRFK